VTRSAGEGMAAIPIDMIEHTPSMWSSCCRWDFLDKPLRCCAGRAQRRSTDLWERLRACRLHRFHCYGPTEMTARRWWPR